MKKIRKKKRERILYLFIFTIIKYFNLISRNLHYFASKSSPTEHLLFYFEAISDLKSNDYIGQNTELTAHNHNGDYSLSTQESLFHKFFLSCLIQAINTNEDLKKIINSDNLIMK